MQSDGHKNQLETNGWRQYGLAIGKLLCLVLISLSVGHPAARAETKQLTGTVNFYNGQTFEQMIQQAQAQARSLIEQAFANNSAVTAVSIKIMGERNGQEVPLLSTTVSRSDWQRHPNLNVWTQYFSHASWHFWAFYTRVDRRRRPAWLIIRCDLLLRSGVQSAFQFNHLLHQFTHRLTAEMRMIRVFGMIKNA